MTRSVNPLARKRRTGVKIRPCRGCGYELKWSGDVGGPSGIVLDHSMLGVAGGPYPHYVPGDRTYCLACITGVSA